MPLYLLRSEWMFHGTDRELKKENCSSIFNAIIISKYHTSMITVKCKRLSQMIMF